MVIEMAIRVKSMLAIMATTRLVYSREGSMRIRDASLKISHEQAHATMMTEVRKTLKSR